MILPLPAASPATSIADWGGLPYNEFLAKMHAILRPETYLEIGTNTGTSLALASYKSIAIDPSFKLTQDVVGAKPACLMFNMTSDAFFHQYSPSRLFGQTVDMAFLDGQHLAEFLVRDFANLEKSCSKNSIVFMHDCMPVDAGMAGRDINADRTAISRYPGWWTGDVWKAVVALRVYRPDLAIFAFDAAWTGLIAVTNLDPSSTVLTDRYFHILQHCNSLSLETYGLDRYVAELNVLPSAKIDGIGDLGSKFWL